MIKNTIDLLSQKDYYGVSERVDIAKGRYEMPTTWKSMKQLIKRMLWQKKLK